jgi:catechol 2,3-dioxygenase-like lactoylglutathione lyase family enzyme
MQLNQVTLPATALARSVAFYQTLGLRLIVDALPRYARLELPEGGSTLSLHHVDAPPGGPGVVVYFECADLDARVAALAAADIAFDSLPTDQPWLWRDPLLGRRQPPQPALAHSIHLALTCTHPTHKPC